MGVPPDEFESLEIHRGPSQVAGFWADTFRVYSDPYSFTLDFVRVDVAESPVTQGVLVARIAVSPFTGTRLAETLQAHFSSYAARSMPEEIRDETLEEEDEDGL